MGVIHAGQCTDAFFHAEVIELLEQPSHLDIHALHFALQLVSVLMSTPSNAR